MLDNTNFKISGAIEKEYLCYVVIQYRFNNFRGKQERGNDNRINTNLKHNFVITSIDVAN